MTPLVLEPTTARTRIVATNFHRYLGMTTTCHHLGWSFPLMKQGRHLLHMRIDMRKERPVARAEVVEPRFTCRCLDETILRTLAVARKAHTTIFAVFRERFKLILPTRALLSLLRGLVLWFAWFRAVFLFIARIAALFTQFIYSECREYLNFSGNGVHSVFRSFADHFALPILFFRCYADHNIASPVSFFRRKPSLRCLDRPFLKNKGNRKKRKKTY